MNQCGMLIPRDDQHLVRVVEKLASEANGHCVELKVVSVSDKVKWEINKVDGAERVTVKCLARGIKGQGVSAFVPGAAVSVLVRWLLPGSIRERSSASVCLMRRAEGWKWGNE